ncbi:MAG: hypothetical protein ABI704_29455, partial [Kofleriaceae bacterium]
VPMIRNPQRGSAMLVTMIIISSLLAGAAVLVSMQLAGNRSSDLTRTGLEATYCAEAGLAIARPAVLANVATWNAALAACNNTYPCSPEPSWLASLDHSVNGSGSGTDFTIYIRDNDDEFPPATLDPLHDSDMRVFIVSRCLKYGETVKEVEELVEYSGGGQNYRTQQGLGRYSGGNNN